MKHNIFKHKGAGTIIGKGTVVYSGMTSEASLLRIDGEVRGNVTTVGALVVGPTGYIKGRVKAASLSVAGTIKGNVKVEENIEILGTGTLIGDADTKGIIIDEKAVFQGNCKMLDVDPKQQKKDINQKFDKKIIKEEKPVEGKDKKPQENKKQSDNNVKTKTENKERVNQEITPKKKKNKPVAQPQNEKMVEEKKEKIEKEPKREEANLDIVRDVNGFIDVDEIFKDISNSINS